MKEGFITTFDNTKIYFYEWTEVKKPIGIVQIFHGMAEYAKRYDDFAKFLNSKGLLVFADDHRGHGKTAESVEKIGTYEGSNIFYDTLQDEIFISKMLKKKYKLPLYIFGHSYGSFLAQAYIENCRLYDKAIMCGSAFMKNRLDIKFGKIVAGLTSKFKGKQAPARLIQKMSFDKYTKKVKEGYWINSDQKEGAKYYSDPFCGKIFSAKFYKDFFGAFDIIYRKEAYSKIDKEKPLYLISGKNDPVGNFGKSVNLLFKFYKNLDVKCVKLSLYENGRHEIINEPKLKRKVYQDILNFLSEKPCNFKYPDCLCC